MYNEQIVRIETFARSHSNGVPYAPATQSVLDATERELGFSLPLLLKELYLRVGNGGFGPGYGVIGVYGGYASDYGTLTETFGQLGQNGTLRADGRIALPFCEWGCNMFSCIDCATCAYEVVHFEEGRIEGRCFTLDDFFRMWLDGVDILSYGSDQVRERHIVKNPFTGKKAEIRGKCRRSE